jgi:Secretion system C-terminal sorting domain
MKQIYPPLLAFVIAFTIFIPLKISAQCICSGGSPATPLTYLDTVLATQASSTSFSFPQFNPSVGTLACISFNDTVSVVVTTAARNTDTTVGHTYIFQTNISDAVVGPDDSGPTDWLVSYNSNNKTYGPIYLDTDKIDRVPPQPRLPDDSTTFGPDTLLNNVVGAGSTTNVASYLGTGTVSFITELTGSAGATFGGTNYSTGIKSNSWGTFRLSYYWCPTILLAENIINFTAANKSGDVQLQWITENEQSGVTYEIEVSRDQASYSPIGYLQSGSDQTSVNEPYHFQYPLSTGTAGVLYFRVKRIAANGTATYTVIKSINLNTGEASAGMQVYPNPVKNTVIFAFDEIQNANFSFQLVNTAGQIIQRNAMTLSGTNQVKLDLTSNPARGLYYLYAKDLTHNQQYITKVIIN